MIPNYSPYDCAYGGLRYIKFFGDLRLRFDSLLVALSDRKDVYLHKIGVWVGSAFKTWVSLRGLATTLSIHIGDIIGLGTKEKMRRPNTKPIVALMKNKKPIWNFTEMNLPRKSSYSDLLCHSARPEIAPFVSGSAPLSASPVPASFGLFNFIPKSLFCGHRHRLLTQCFRPGNENSGIAWVSSQRKVG